MKPLALLSLLLLAACSRHEAAPPPVAAAPAPVADTWPGKYEGDLIVNISGTPGAHRVWLLEAAADGCTGDLGVATAGEPARDVSETALDINLTPKDAAACTIHITRSGQSLTVAESEGCGQYHGATCSFNGTATQVK